MSGLKLHELVVLRGELFPNASDPLRFGRAHRSHPRRTASSIALHVGDGVLSRREVVSHPDAKVIGLDGNRLSSTDGRQILTNDPQPCTAVVFHRCSKTAHVSSMSPRSRCSWAGRAMPFAPHANPETSRTGGIN